jgi:hypothetical protein
MTALTKYQRLECVGLWRLTATAQLREVVVGLRDTTLVLADPRSEMALSHWSLPSVERVNPGEMPALFTPGRLDDGSPRLDDGRPIRPDGFLPSPAISGMPLPWLHQLSLLPGPEMEGCCR